MALISFGLLFDGFVALGRAGAFGLAGAVGLEDAAAPSRYTMPNLLILIALVAYAWVHASWRWAVPILVCIQLVVATAGGLTAATTLDRDLTISARLAVNVDRVPVTDVPCLWVYVYPNPDRDIIIARRDRLAEFGSAQKYQDEGLPAILRCRSL